MPRLLTICLLAICAGGGCLGQGTGEPRPFELLTNFLQLSDAQVKAIVATNDGYNMFADSKQRRIYDVQADIAVETAKKTLDALAIGIRYAEIEAICRDLTDKAKEAQTKNLAVLTAAQKAKLAVLQDALTLNPVASQGVNAGMLGTIAYAPASLAGSPAQGYWYSVSSFYGLNVANGCRYNQPFPGAIIPARAVRTR